MPNWSQRSQGLLDSVHPRLQALFNEVIKHVDCTVCQDGGLRTPERQAELVRKKVSKTLNSKHLTGHAIDVAPYPVIWPDATGATPAESNKARARFYLFAGFVLGMAARLGIPLRWGGDWDGDYDLRDQKFDDLVHFELVGAASSVPDEDTSRTPASPDG